MTLTAKDWERIDELVDALGCSIDEAKQMLLDDKAIDKGEKMFELSADMEAGAKKARRAETKSVIRKEDTDKTTLMSLISDAIGGVCPEGVNRTKPGELMFEYNGRRFKIVLSAPRT